MMDQFKVGEFWASPSEVLWRVAATEESKHASYAVLTRVKKDKGRITLPMGATKGWERIATAAEDRALVALCRLIGGGGCDDSAHP
jgi:hypothetical protein